MAEDWIGVVEAAYALGGGVDAWVSGLRDRLAPIFDQGLGVSVQTFHATATSLETEAVAVHGGPPGFEAIVRATNANAKPDAVSRFLGCGTSVSTMSEAIFDAIPEAEEFFAESSNAYSRDVLGILALCGRGRGVSVSIPIAERRRPSGRERRDLGRIGVHLAAGLRLRELVPDVPASLDDPTIEAVLETDGHTRDARGGAREAEPRARLREAVRRLERARSADRRSDPESLDLWEGLVRGRWSLVDHFDRDGRRYLVAHRNAPALGDPRGLSPREHQVAEHVGAGESNKEIAYAFGISESAVANAIARAQRKLALGSRVALAAFFAPGGLRSRLVAVELGDATLAIGSTTLLDESALQALTPAERDVALHLLTGATNAEIGRRRGTSEHTIANQVKSLYERMGVGSRVGLAARVGRGGG